MELYQAVINLFPPIKRDLFQMIIVILLLTSCRGLQPVNTTSWPWNKGSLLMNIYSYFSPADASLNDSDFSTIILNEYIEDGQITLPCLLEKKDFAGKLILKSRSDVTGKHYTVVPSLQLSLFLPSSLRGCPHLTENVSLYLNIRKLQLSANQTLTISTQDHFLNNRTKQFSYTYKYADWNKDDIDSYGHFYSFSSSVEIAVQTRSLGDISNSIAAPDNTVSVPFQTRSLIVLDYAIFFNGISLNKFGLSRFCSCPQLDHGILPAEFFCDSKLIVCPERRLTADTSEREPSLPANYYCNQNNGLPNHIDCTINDSSSTQPTLPSPLPSSSPSYVWWRPQSELIQWKGGNDFRDGLVYSTIVLSVIIVVGLGLFVLHYIQTRRKMSESSNDIFNSPDNDFLHPYGQQANLGMTNDEGEPPPPYTPPGAPPSYCESQEGNVCVILRRDDDDVQPSLPDLNANSI